MAGVRDRILQNFGLNLSSEIERPSNFSAIERSSESLQINENFMSQNPVIYRIIDHFLQYPIFSWRM
jgi:hypothetical protein